MARQKPAKNPIKFDATASNRLRTLAEMVSETGVSAGQIAMAARGGYVVATVRGKYDRDQTLLGLIRYLQSRVGQLPIYDNDSQCSSATGIPISTIRQTRKRHQIGPNRAVGLEALLKAMFASNGEDPAAMKSEYAALNEKMDYEQKAGLLVRKSDVAHTAIKGLSVLFRMMDQRSNVDLPPVLAGLDPADMQRELVKSDDELKANIRREWSDLMRNGESKNGEAK